MKLLIVASLLSMLTACGSKQSTAEIKAEPMMESDVKKELTPEEVLAESLKAFTSPLLVDAQEFAAYGRTEIEKVFGPILDTGKIVYQDAYVENGDGRFNDFARLHFIAKVKSPLLESAATYASFTMTTRGTATVTLVTYDAADRNVSLLFPGWLVSYKEDIAEEDMEAVVEELQAKHPDVMIERIAASLLPRLISVHAKEKVVAEDGTIVEQKATGDLTKEQLLALQDILAEFNADSRIDYREGDSEVRNPGLRGASQDLGTGSEALQLDLNAMRSVTLEKLQSGSPATTVPTLPCPFSKAVSCKSL